MSPRAVIVGSGASGGMSARLLAKAGYQVIILEKGRNLFSGLGGPASQVKNKWANDEVGHEARGGPENQDVMLEPRSFRAQGFTSSPREFVGDVNTLPTTVGGGTTHYDAKARRLREVDFVANSLFHGQKDPADDTLHDQSAVPGANYANWPMQYKHLEAFYAVSEEVVGIQGPASGSPGAVQNTNKWESWRSTPFPVPPGVDQLNSLLASYAGVALGYSEKPVPVPTAIVSRPYRDGRPACVDCGFCLDFGCPINAKSGGVWQVNEAIAAGAQLISRAVVTGFEYGPSPSSSSRQAVTAVNFLFLGSPADVVMAPGASGPYFSPVEGANNPLPIDPANGDLLILANTPIEATRLSLLSGITPGDPNLEPSGQLGKNLMFHLQTSALAVLDRKVHSFRGRTSTHTLDAFAGAGPSVDEFFRRGGAEVPRAGITELGGNLNPVQEATEVAAFMFGERLKAYMALAPFNQRLVAMTLQGEDMPQLGNFVDLDQDQPGSPGIKDVYGQWIPRVTYSNHPYELAASAYYAPKMVEVLEAIGAPPSPFPGIHPVFAASINTSLPAFPTGSAGVDDALYQLTQPTIGTQTPSGNATPFSNVPGSRHILGTHRMALDADHGPCDPFGRYWNFDNLYHSGGGLYVTAAGFNVTLTMWALSYWQAAAIVTGTVVPGRAYRYSDMDGIAHTLRSVIGALDGDTSIGGFIGSGGYDTFVSNK